MCPFDDGPGCSPMPFTDSESEAPETKAKPTGRGYSARRSRVDRALTAEEAFQKCASDRWALSKLNKPDFLVLSSLNPPGYLNFLDLASAKYFTNYPFGTMLRSGLVVRSVNKSLGGQNVTTLGVFSTCMIPKHAFVTYYGGVLTDRSKFHSVSDKTHAVRLPNTHFVEDGKMIANMFTRPMQLGKVSYPCLDPSSPFISAYLNRGIGCMMNHASRRFANCVLRYVVPPPSLEVCGHVPIPILIAKRQIQPDEELTWFYNNYESYSFS